MVKPLSRTILSRCVITALFVAVLAGNWDIWWHSAVGRDTFWEPPHLFLYSGIIAAILLAAYGWYASGEKTWKWITVVLVFAPLSAPFDDLWHRLFGVEPVNSPLIVWSPPHVMLALSIAVGMLLTLSVVLQEDPDVTAQQFFGAAGLATAFGLFLFLTQPLEPTGPYRVLGFAGAGFIAAVIVVFLGVSVRLLPGTAPATLAMVFLLLIHSLTASKEVAPGVIITPHDHPPQWLVVFAHLVPAALFDLLRGVPMLILGPLSSVTLSTLLYGFAVRFFAPEFQYTATETLGAILASAVAGLLAGMAVMFYDARRFFPSIR